MKRKDYISWDSYFMGIAILSALRSKGPNIQIGACVVNSCNKIVAVGYNGMPTDCNDDAMPWERSAESTLDTKYPDVCHGELNAILNSNIENLKGCTLYITLFPCNECTKAIIQCGITKVVYLENKYHYIDSTKAAINMFNKSRVYIVKHNSASKPIILWV